MKLNFTKYLILLFFIASCVHQEKELKEYGHKESDDHGVHIALQLSEFPSYGQFIDRLREVTCNDSIPKITIEKKNLTQNIYPIEHCEPIIFDPKEKHYVSFARGKAYKGHSSKELKTDSMGWILKNDFAYYRTSNGSNNLEGYLIIIESNRNERVDGIEKFLTNLTLEFDKLETNLDLNISFWEQVPYMPPEQTLENEKTEEN